MTFFAKLINDLILQRREFIFLILKQQKYIAKLEKELKALKAN